ncbi:MAG TPA: hypothetical protein VG347_10555, partial [Verrucomicrobiae bacterium]|nr:hypothetical protein [Verrucomicrobiae bacterium]
MAWLIGMLCLGWCSAQATPVLHGISAANINVQQNDASNNAVSVTLTTPVEINDFRVINNVQTSRADYFVQIGASASDDVTGGILMSSITDNGRDNGEGNGTNWGTPAIDSNASGSPGTSGQYWIPVFGTMDDTNYPEYNFDVAGAYFPYNKGWYGGWLVNATGVNNGVSATLSSDKFWGNPSMVLGTDVIPLGGGKITVDLRRFGLDSRTNAILLCVGGKNEENFADSQTNADGTWLVTTRDDASGSAEADPAAFVAIPVTNHMIVSGRFFGDSSIGLHSGPFSVTNPAAGVFHLTIPGVTPGHGVLIISGEEGGGNNGDNIVSYQATADGWDIQTRDVGDGNHRPNLQALPAGDAVVSFVYIPAPTVGVTVTPTNGLATTENGTTASFTVTLDAPPTAEVDLNLSSSQPDAGTPSASQLVFLPSNWNVPQTVTVTGLNNSSTVPQAYAINFAPAVSADTNYSGVSAPSVSLVNIPNGQPGIFLIPTNGLVTTGSGGTATFEVILNVQPQSNVTVGFTSSDTTEGTVSPASVVFNSANWSTPQFVTVTGADDGLVNGNVAYQIIGAPAVSTDPAYSGLAVGNVSVLNLDSDVAGVNVSTGTSISVAEGGTAQFTVALSAKPTDNVIITYTSSDTSVGTVAPSVLTFTPANWNVPQTVTLTGLNNLSKNANTAYSLTATVSSVNLGYSMLVIPDIAATTVKAVGLPSGTTLYGFGMAPVGVDGRSTVNQAIDFDGATLTFTLTANANATDVLSVRNDVVNGGQIGVAGNTVSFGGSPIATFAGGAGATPLVITIQNGVTGSSVQALMDAVTFSTTSTNALAQRTLQVTLNYGAGSSSTVSKSIRVGLLRLTQYQVGADYGYGVYNNEADVELTEATPSATAPAGTAASTGLFIDTQTSAGTPNECQVLMRFDNLTGTNAGQIPPGALIVSADLIVDIINPGNGATLNRMLIP